MKTCNDRTDSAKTPAPRARLRTPLAIVAVALSLACPATLRADEAAPPDRLPMNLIAAQAVARAAAVDLKLAGNPTPDDFAIALELLKSAVNLAPDNQTIIRLTIEAAASAGDTETVKSLTRRLVKLDPSDTVAQLRAISTNISDLQNADERLKAYDLFLGPKGAEIDASVRSRLALDAALLLRERGDIKGFADRLSQAMQLDPTNQDAATLGLTFYSQTPSATPVGRLDLMLNVLYANPLDPGVYDVITQELLNSGAFTGAARFARLHSRLAGSQNDPSGADQFTRRELAEWNFAGAESLIKQITDGFAKAREAAAAQRKQMEAAGTPPEKLPNLDEAILPFGSQRSLLLAAAAIGDQARVKQFLTDLVQSGRTGAAMLTDPAKRPEGMTEEQVAAKLMDYQSELTWLRLWTGQQIDDAASGVAAIKQGGRDDPDTIARLEGWLAFRRGENETAERLLKPISPADPLATLGLAMLSESRGAKDEAASLFADVVARTPASAAGAFARTRYTTLVGKPPALSETAAKLEQLAAAVPEWLETMPDSPPKIEVLEVMPLRAEISDLERTPVRVTLRNTSPIPLAVGPDGPINSSLMFMPAVEIGQQRIPSLEYVAVASLDRRLRLMPNEQIEVIAWPDMGVLSSTMEILGDRPAKIRWRALQGFELDDQQFYKACAQCQTVDTRALTRRPPPRTDAPAEGLRYSFQTGSPRDMAETALAIKLRVAQPLPSLELSPKEQADLMEALSTRYTALDKETRILLLSLLPNQINMPATARFDQLAAADADEDVLAVELATRVARSDDPVFDSAKVKQSPRLAALAALIKDRQQRGVEHMSRARIKLGEPQPAPAGEPGQGAAPANAPGNAGKGAPPAQPAPR